MRIRILSLAAFALAIVSLAHSARAVAPPAGAANWPGWRGDGSGISSEKNIPIYWSVTENVAWKTPLPQGNSSPVIWSDRIFLTGWADSGKQRSVFCLDAKDGRIVWQKDIAVENVAKTYEKNGYASSTCATDGEKVFAFFDSPGLVALDVNGTVLWSVDLGPFNTDWGMAASPAIYKDVVLMCCDQDKDSFIVALNKADGKERWRTPRPPCGRQYATPIIITVDGKDQIVVNGGTVVAYEPEKGKEIWTCRGMINSLTPSAVFADGLVYAVSGRNGPGVAIDPTGRGDVTDTHVRMHVPVGGPYVPSPLVIGAGGKDGPPILMLPGDDGAMRFVDKTGTVVVKHRVPGHFTSSPVLAEDRIYWGSEKGDVFVVDVSDCTGRKPKVKAITTNALGEKILASPALADGRVYIRSEKHLFCIEGRKKIKSAAVAKASGSFPELKQLFEAHPAPEGDDIAIRLDVVEALAQLKNPEAIPFLKDVAVKDNHWDVSEAAAKALGQLDRSAIPALIELLEGKDWRPYLKVVPAGHLARMQATESIPALTAALKHGDPLVRVACLNALAAIVADRDAEAAKALPAFVAALDDREGIVRKAAIEAVAAVSGKAGDQRDAIVAKLLDCAADRNVLVASAAKDVLINQLKAREDVMKDEILYGEQRRESTARELAAGPMRLKFQDGELRYIYVGDREIIRRVYFAVRDERWDTVMPEFTRLNVEDMKDGFKINLAAQCKNDVAEFTWSGSIVGTKDGKITFTAEGQANRDFRSYRVGFCVLYGTPAVIGQAYELLDAEGDDRSGRKATPGEFPRNISAGMLANVNTFRALRYKTADGLEVTAGLEDGTLFGMEDQRNFGDSSFKAMAGLAFKYPNVVKGDKGKQVFVLQCRGGLSESSDDRGGRRESPARPRDDRAASLPTGPVRVTISQPLPGAKLPKLLPAAESKEPAGGFMSYNGDPKKHAGDELVHFGYKPSQHMPDDDMFMENASAVLDQVRSIRSFAAKAKFRIDPIDIDTPYQRPGQDPRDPRNRGLFAASWCTAVMKYLALGSVDEAVFTAGPAYADLVLKTFEPHAGKGLLGADMAGTPPLPIEALAVDAGDSLLVWVVNMTDRAQQAVVAGLGADGKARVQRINAATKLDAKLKVEKADLQKGELAIDLGPFEVCIIEAAK